MGKLLQVAGFPCETTAIQLVEFLKKIFSNDTLQNVWFDPYREPRAVAMFLHELDEEKLYQLIQQEDIAFQDQILAFKTEKPTLSIFVRTYGSIQRGTIDKLGFTFHKIPSRRVEHIQPLDDDCYEITFSGGWDAVQEVCKRDWSLGKTKLTVCPYFECFKEPFVEIHERLSVAEVADQRLQNICTRPLAPMSLTNPHLVKLPIKPHLKLSENIVQEKSCIAEATKDSDYRSTSDKYEKSTVYFKHQCIPILLRCLHFDKALDGYDCHLSIHEDGDSAELEFEITGPKLKVKKVTRLLDQEYIKVKAFKTSNNFLALNKVLPDLKKRIDATSSVVVLTEMGNDISLVVTDRHSNKVTFQDFVSSLVFEEHFSPLSVEDYQEHNKWIEQFNEDYKIGHIFVSETNVTFTFLSHKKQKMNVIIELMKSKLQSHSVVENEFKENNCKEVDCNTSDHQNHTELSDSGNARKQENLGDMKSYSEDEKIINEVYCIKSSFVMWLLRTLNLRSTVAELCPTLILEFKELDLKVLISGQAKQVQAVKQWLKEEDDRISLTEYEETFLVKEKIQSQLLHFIDKHGLSLVPDSKDPTQLKLVVTNDKGKTEQFDKFIKSLLVTKACHTLPNLEVYESVAWKTFQESFNSQYEFCEIYVSNDLMVCLLALAHKSEELEMVIHAILQNSSQYVSSDDKSMISCKPADSQHIKYQEMLPENIGDRSGSENTAVKKTKDKKRGPTLTLICQNNFFVWLLDQLKFTEFVENKFTGTSVRIDVEENEVVIKGDKAEIIKSQVLELDGQISYNEDEENFLSNPKILQQIETTMKKAGIQLSFDDSENSELLVKYQDGQNRSLIEFALNFVVKHECLTLPDARMQSIQQWKELVESLHSTYPLHQISVERNKVMILTLEDSDALETNEIENDINNFVLVNYDDDKSLIKRGSQANIEDARKSKKSEKNEKMSIEFIPFKQHEVQFLNIFLQQEFHHLKDTFNAAEINIKNGGFELRSSSQNCVHEMKKRIKSLFDTTINERKKLQYPGLVSFFNSEDGLKLISEMSTKYECFIETPMEGANKTNSELEVLNPEDQRLNYQVTLLGTAKCPGFKVHLVQGNIRDMKSDVKVNFCISSEAHECIFKTNKSSCDITISLPRWKAPEKTAYQEHFDKLRKSLSSVICLVLDQVNYLRSTTVTFDTNAIHDKEFPFPLDVIAKIVTEQLLEMFTDSSDSSEGVDVYICEQNCESVFKAFSFYMKRMGIDFGTPDQVSWDQICEKDTFKYPDYRKYKYDVEIVASTPEFLVSRNVFCYPIQPSLEASSCPVYFDPRSSKSLVEKSLKELMKDLPDGLLIGDVQPVSCFPFNRDVLVYCFPEWGSGVYQALKNSLKNIFKQSYKYDAFIITPPGLGSQKYPLPYLVQTFFQLLDEIITKENSYLQRKIYLVVHNTEYKMAFESELNKRHPKISEKQNSWWSVFSSRDSSDKAEHKGKRASSCTDSSILVSKVVSLPIKYWGKSMEKINKAHSEIERELKRLMDDNKLACTFNKKETEIFQKISKQMGDDSLLITFKKTFSTQNQGQQNKNAGGKGRGNKSSKKSKKEETPSAMVMTGSILTVQGLSQICVRQFRDVIFSTIEDEQRLNRSSSIQSNETDLTSEDEEKLKKNISAVSKEPGASKNNSSLTSKGGDRYHDEVNKNSQKKVNAKDKTHETAVLQNISDRNSCKCDVKTTESNNDPMIKETAGQTEAPKIAACSSKGFGSFNWLYENYRKAHITFNHFKEKINNIIEASYSESKKKEADIDNKKVTHVDFTDMTVTLNHKKRGIIRQEKLDTSQHVSRPTSWTVTEDEVWKAVILQEDSKIFPSIVLELKENIGQHQKIQVLSIKRIENMKLYLRFKAKKSLLDGDCTNMWLKVSEDNVPLVCQFGIHSRFSAMRDENMGDGVLFKQNPWDCLEENEIKDKKTVNLFRSRIILGRTGPGRKRFRCVPQDTKSQAQDSVQGNGQAMIFSDAQAYPSHLITFTFD